MQEDTVDCRPHFQGLKSLSFTPRPGRYVTALSSSARAINGGGMLVHVGFQVGWRDGDKALDNWRGPATHSVCTGRLLTFFSRTVTADRSRGECKSGRQQEDTARSDCGRGHGGPFLSTLHAGDALYRWGHDLASSGINNPNHHIGPAHAVSQTAYARCLCFPGRLPSRAIFPLAGYPPSILVLMIWGDWET